MGPSGPIRTARRRRVESRRAHGEAQIEEALRAPAARRRWVAKRTASSPAPRAGGSGTWRPARSRLVDSCWRCSSGAWLEAAPSDSYQQCRPQRQREPPKRRGRDRLAVGNVAGRCGALPQQHGDALTGAGHPRTQRHVTEAAPEGARRVFLAAGAGDDGRVQVQDVPVGQLAAAHREPGEPAGSQGEQRPHHAAYRGAGALDPGPRRGCRSPPEHGAKSSPRPVRRTPPASGTGVARPPRCPSHRARLRGPAEPAPCPGPAGPDRCPRQRRIQGSGQGHAVGDLPQQHHARAADQVLAAGPHGKPMIQAGILRPSGASPSRFLDLDSPDHPRREAPFCCQGVRRSFQLNP